MPESTHARWRAPRFGSAALVAAILALSAPVTALAAEDECDGDERSRACAALGGGTGESPSQAALDDDSRADEDRGSPASAALRQEESEGEESPSRAALDEKPARSGDEGSAGEREDGAEEDDSLAGRTEARGAGRDASAGKVAPPRTGARGYSDAALRDPDRLADAIRRETRARINGQLRPRLGSGEADGSARGGTGGASGAENDETVVSIASGEQIVLYAGGHHYRVRARVVVAGYEPPRRAGRIVVLQVRKDDRGDWVPVAHARTGEGGKFELVWYPQYPGRYQVRVRPYNSNSTIEPSDIRRIFVYRSAVASWYGPGFYGNRTACGQTFTSRLMGVAHRSLPCGYLVRVRYNGRMKTVPVVDRGPYIDGRDYDLTEALKNYLGFSGVDRIWVTA